MLPHTLHLSNSVTLSLLLDQQMRIKEVIGSECSFFNVSTIVLVKEAPFGAIDWGHRFTTPPIVGQHWQTLHTTTGQEIFYSCSQLDNPSSDIHYLVTMFNRSALLELNHAPHYKSLATDDNYLIMDSQPMKRIVKIIEAISQVDSTVLLLGETGVGKSAIASLIHRVSNRGNEPFVAINCGAIPENLIEAEFFGYESGAFTGGKKGGKLGLFEVADKGTIFLDEIAELPYNLQAKLLGVLQDQVIRKVGGTETRRINVRVIAATNKDLLQLAKEKKFREDLFYRLNVVPLTIPALKERKEDISKLIDHFIAKYNKKYGLLKQLSPKVREEFLNYHWPGNIRELENTIERFVVTNMEEVIEGFLHRTDMPSSSHTLLPLKMAKRLLEKELILKAYELYGSTHKAAKALEVDQSTIVKKMKEYKKNDSFL